MNIRLDPINEQGIFDNDLYMSKNYEYIYKSALKYISLEGFDEEVGVYNISIYNQQWVLRVS